MRSESRAGQRAEDGGTAVNASLEVIHASLVDPPAAPLRADTRSPTNLGLSQVFVDWVPRAGNTVSGSAADASVCVANEGGEIRFYVRVDGTGQFVLTRAERSDAERPVLWAEDLRDIERFLIMELSGDLRQAKRLPALQIPSRESELAEGFQTIHRDGFVWLDDGQRPSIHFPERDPYRPQPAVQFSHYANASIGDLICSIDSDSGGS